MARAYAAATGAERARAREAMLTADAPDPARVLVGDAPRVRLREMSGEEIRYLAGRYADRRRWDELWTFVRDLHSQDSSVPCTVWVGRDEPVRSVGVEIPKHLIALLEKSAAPALSRPLSGREGVGVLLAIFLTRLCDDFSTDRPTDGARLGVVLAYRSPSARPGPVDAGRRLRTPHVQQLPAPLKSSVPLPWPPAPAVIGSAARRTVALTGWTGCQISVELSPTLADRFAGRLKPHRASGNRFSLFRPLRSPVLASPVFRQGASALVKEDRELQRRSR